MAKFKTIDGKEWVIDVTYLTVKRVRDLCGVNLLDICNLDKESLSGWVADDLKVLEVVCAVVRPQLAAIDMSDGISLRHATAACSRRQSRDWLTRSPIFSKSPGRGW